MSLPTAAQKAAVEGNEAASAQDVSPSQSRKQSIWASSILTIVLVTFVLAAAIALVTVTFLYWAPHARSWGPSSYSSPKEDPSRGSPVPDDPQSGTSTLPSQEEPSQHNSPEPLFDDPFSPDFGAGVFDDFDLENATDDSAADETTTGSADTQSPFDSSTPLSPPSTPPSFDNSISPITPPALHPRNPPDDTSTDRLMTPEEVPPSSYVQGYRSPKHNNFRFLLHGPSPTDPEEHTALYEETPQRSFCAVTAGNNDFTLSGRLTNLIADAMEDSGKPMSVEGINASVRAAYSMAASRARQQPGTVVAVPLKYHSIYSKLFAFLPAYASVQDSRLGQFASLIILGIFKDACIPHGDPANRFHVYAVPPKDISRNKSFFLAFKSTYYYCLKVVQYYNFNNPQAQIKQLRVFLPGHESEDKSGKTDKYLVKAAVSVMLQYASREGLSFVLDFPYDHENTSFYQMQRSLCPSSRIPLRRAESQEPPPPSRS